MSGCRRIGKISRYARNDTLERSVVVGLTRTLFLMGLSNRFRNVFHGHFSPPDLFHSAAQLQDTSRAIGHQNLCTAGGNVCQLAAQEFRGDFREFERIGSSETAAHIFIFARYIVQTRVSKEFPRLLNHPHAAT